MGYDYSELPQEMKESNRWCLWKKIKKEDGKTTKIPIDAMTGKGAKSNDESTWCDFITALDAEKKYHANGLGFMLGGGFFGIDIDHAIDEKSLIDEFDKSLGTYCEVSQSGEGVHFICKGSLPQGRRKKGNIEMYDNCRFFALTGNSYNSVSTINECTKKVIPLFEKYLGREEVHHTNETTPLASMTDSEIVQKALSSKCGARFSVLYRGEWENAYTSQSNADMALCNYLAFFCGKDEVLMDRIFRSSGLMRDKWDEMRGEFTYGKRTISQAINHVKSVYNPYEKNDESFSREMEDENNPKKKIYNLDDTGNAERFLDYFHDIIRYNANTKSWDIYNGKTWERDEKKKIKELANEMLADMRTEALKETNEKVQFALAKNVKHMASKSGKEAMLEEAKNPSITTLNSDYDKDKHLLNCNNGIVNLKTGELIPHDKSYMMCKNTNIDVDMKNEPKRFLKFLDEILCYDKELIHYIHKAIGYTLTGETKEQVFFYCEGTGSNGKSVLFDVIYNILGSYASAASIQSFLEKNTQGNANNDIAKLNGARFVKADEPPERKAFDESLVKSLTGEESIQARFLHCEFFEFFPKFKLWIDANHKVKIRDTSNGMFRRLKTIIFQRTFSEKEKDKDLKEKLAEEYPQILGWAVKGAMMWYKEGLDDEPRKVIEANKAYKTEMDIVSQFLNNCETLVIGEGHRVQSDALYKLFIKWCKENEEEKMTRTKFGIEMKKQGQFQKVNKGGKNYYNGLYIETRDEYRADSESQD